VLEIVAAGMRFVARWEEELAPSTVAAFKASLPMEERIIHCRWSGESNWIPWGTRDFGIGPENATSYPHPGELALYPGGQSETELLFPYGYCNFASKAGQLWANHFATVVEGAEQLPKLGKLTLWEGAQPIRFSALSRGDRSGKNRHVFVTALQNRLHLASPFGPVRSAAPGLGVRRSSDVRQTFVRARSDTPQTPATALRARRACRARRALPAGASLPHSRRGRARRSSSRTAATGRAPAGRRSGCPAPGT